MAILGSGFGFWELNQYFIENNKEGCLFNCTLISYFVIFYSCTRYGSLASLDNEAKYPLVSQVSETNISKRCYVVISRMQARSPGLLSMNFTRCRMILSKVDYLGTFINLGMTLVLLPSIKKMLRIKPMGKEWIMDLFAKVGALRKFITKGLVRTIYEAYSRNM